MTTKVPVELFDAGAGFTIGSGAAEDTKIVFDGNAQDFYVALDDSADDLIIGLGSTVGTTPIMSFDENKDVTINEGKLTTSGANGADNQGLNITDTGYSKTHKIYGDNSLHIQADSGQQILFKPNATEAARFDASGNLGIGTTSPSRQLHLNNASDHGIMAITGSTSSLAGVVFGDTADDDVSSIIHNNSGNYLYLSTSSTERMRIAANGNVLIGTTSSSGTTRLTVVQPNNDDPLARFDMAAAVNAIRGVEIRVTDGTANSANKFFLQGDDNGNTRVELRTDGSIYSSYYTITSDERLKENIEDCEPMLEKLKQVRIVDFDWKENAGPKSRQRGVIAQEIESIFPELIHQPKEYKEFKKTEMTPILVKAIQEQQEQIESLQQQIEVLKNGN